MAHDVTELSCNMAVPKPIHNTVYQKSASVSGTPIKKNIAPKALCCSQRSWHVGDLDDPVKEKVLKAQVVLTCKQSRGCKRSAAHAEQVTANIMNSPVLHA